MNPYKLSAAAFGVLAASVFASSSLDSAANVAIREPSATVEASASGVMPSVQKALPNVSLAGRVEFDAFVPNWNRKGSMPHDFVSVLDLDVKVAYDEHWSAEVEMEGAERIAYPYVYFNGAYVKYRNGDAYVKVGDMPYTEGAVTYHRYDNGTAFAAGMKQQNMRGLEGGFAGAVLGIGLSAEEKDSMTIMGAEVKDENAYFVHAAYDLEIAGQKIRPYFNYKGYDKGDYNSIRVGVNAELVFGNVKVHATYGLLDDCAFKGEPVVSHSFLLEPTLDLGKFSIKGSAYFAYLADNVKRATVIDMPEFYYVHAEPSFLVTSAFKAAVMGEYHSNTLDRRNIQNSFAYVGPKLYFNPNKFISLDVYGAAVLPIGDTADSTGTVVKFTKDDKVLFDAGAEAVFTF